ncbi:hypothetical protein [Candidatus Hodgkinia cicadicola]|uniref:hypothetical protein n=1 Tax=Candidatus Hodgkinia cicadicola TaxID=573658 RepID=UPI001788C38D
MKVFDQQSEWSLISKFMWLDGEVAIMCWFNILLSIIFGNKTNHGCCNFCLKFYYW